VKRFIIEYNPDIGDVIPDGKIYEYVDKIISTNQEYVNVGSTVLFDAFRLAVRECKIDNRIVIVKYDGKEYELDEFGKVLNCPISLYKVYDKMIYGLLKKKGT